MKKVFKNEKWIKVLILANQAIIFVLIFLVVRFSHGFFNDSVNFSETIVSTTSSSISCLTIDMSDPEILEFSSSSPMSDQNAKSNLTPVTYIVTNHCANTDVDYNVGLTTLSDGSTYIENSKMKAYVEKKIGSGNYEQFLEAQALTELQEFESNGISATYIANKIQDDTSLNTYTTKSNYVIDSVAIPAASSISYKIWLWIDENATGTSNKPFKSILSLIEDGESLDIDAFTEDYMDFGGSDYIDTGIRLFSEENYLKDFEMGFTILDIDSSRFGNAQSNTVINSLLEAAPYPGITFRIQNYKWFFQVGNGIKSVKLSFEPDEVETFKIVRYNGKVYYILNDDLPVFVLDVSTLSQTFDTPVTFGVSFDSNGDPMPSRFLDAEVSDMYVRFVDDGSNIYKMIDDAIEDFVGGTLTEAFSSPAIHVFDGTGTSSVSADVSLFSLANLHKDFVVSFVINEFDFTNQSYNQATLFNAKNEGDSYYPGIYVRKQGNNYELAYKYGTGHVSTVQLNKSTTRINIIRKSDVLYYQADFSQILELGNYPDISDFNTSKCFDVPVTFGSNLNGSGVPDRIIVGKLSEMKIKMSAS